MFLAYFILGITHTPSLTGQCCMAPGNCLHSDLERVTRYFAGVELTAPFDVTWRVERAHVTVRWKHQQKNEPSHGYYISVQEVLRGLRLGKPDFVHVKGSVRAASIRGLKPRALYEMKVKRRMHASSYI